MNARPWLVVALLAGALRSQSDWQLCGSAAEVRIAGARASVLRGPRAATSGLPDGDYTVHFGRDALGKPASLAFAVEDGACVHLAVEAAAAAAGERFAADDPVWRPGAGPGAWGQRTLAPGRGDLVLELEFTAGTGTEAVGLVARHGVDGSHYAFVFDRTLGEVRLVRTFGTTTVLGRIARPSDAAPPRKLAFQLEGFRLQGLVDDEVVLQCLDGALAHGDCGVAWRRDPPDWRELVVAPPAHWRSSAASVIGPGSARTLHVEAALEPGHWHVLELRTDRPHPLLAVGLAGIEPGLLLPPGGAHVLCADLRGSLGVGSFGELGTSGAVRSRVEWPDLPDLRLQTALARVQFVTADGSWITATSPAVPVHR